MAAQPGTNSQYWSPRGSISQQLLGQPRPDRHNYSYHQPNRRLQNLCPNQYPDLPLHPDLLRLFKATPYAALIQPPYRFRAADPHGWYIINDSSLLPTLESRGGVTDGRGRYLGQVVGDATERLEAASLRAGITSPIYEFSSADLGNFDAPSPADPFEVNTWSPSGQQPSNLATPVSINATLASGAETLVVDANSGCSNADADSQSPPVCDRKFDLGVPLM